MLNVTASAESYTIVFVGSVRCVLATAHLDSLGLTWNHLDSLGFTWIHLESLGLTWIHLDSLGLTWTHLNSLDLTWIHLASFTPKRSNETVLSLVRLPLPAKNYYLSSSVFFFKKKPIRLSIYRQNNKNWD